MKGKLLIALLCSNLVFYSCKKDSTPGIAGKWLNTAVYTDPAKGGNGWSSDLKFPQLLTLDQNARFYSFTDVPEGSGTYQFHRVSNQLRLDYEASQYTVPAGCIIYTVEHLDIDRMVTTIVYSDGFIFKREYVRLKD